MKRCLVIGSSLLDLYIDKKTLVSKEKGRFTISPGGKGFNIACAVSRFGIQTELLTDNGNDNVGRLLLNEMRRLGIHALHNKNVSDKAHIYINIVDKDSTNNSYGVILPNPPDSLVLPDLKWEAYQLIIISSNLKESELDKLESIKHNYPHIKLVLEAISRKTIETFIPYLGIFDFFIANKKEIETLMAVSGLKSIKETMDYIHKLGIEIVVATLGIEGALVNDKGNLYRVPAYEVKDENIYPTGAGDATTGCFCVLHYFCQVPVYDAIKHSMYYAYQVLLNRKPYLSKLPQKSKKFVDAFHE